MCGNELKTSEITQNKKCKKINLAILNKILKAVGYPRKPKAFYHCGTKFDLPQKIEGSGFIKSEERE
jgi:hypothetical protein